jgi:hypothetical protein
VRKEREQSADPIDSDLRYRSGAKVPSLAQPMPNVRSSPTMTWA